MAQPYRERGDIVEVRCPVIGAENKGRVLSVNRHTFAEVPHVHTAAQKDVVDVPVPRTCAAPQCAPTADIGRGQSCGKRRVN